MKIAILTQYYKPEMGAPQNRLYEMAVGLKNLVQILLLLLVCQIILQEKYLKNIVVNGSVKRIWMGLIYLGFGCLHLM